LLTQQRNAIAIGSADATTGGAGYANQGTGAIAIGVRAGLTGQGSGAIAIGYNAANLTQGQGANSIIISSSTVANNGIQAANTIVMNATASGVTGAGSSGTYISPIRSLTQSTAIGYNTTTSELTYYTILGTPTITALTVGVANALTVNFNSSVSGIANTTVTATTAVTTSITSFFDIFFVLQFFLLFFFFF
jgi:hypothetical protein